jgi:ankyrin repeat protein
MDSIFTKMSKLEFMNDRRAPISVKTQGLIAYKLYQLESGRKRYAEVLTEILDNHWNAPELLATLDQIVVMVEPHLVPAQLVIEEEEWNRGGRSRKEFNKPTFASELEAVRDFIRNRKDDIQTEIANGMPIWSKRPDPPFAIPEDGDFAKGFLQLTENTLAGAARTGDIEAIKQHIAEGADVNELLFEMPPLTWAVTMGQIEAAELLLQHGADINGRNRDRNTALHLAVFLGRAEIAKLLIKNGADVNAKNNDGATPIDLLGVPWEMTQFLSKPLGIKLEQEQVEAGKAEIAKILRVSNPSEGENTFSVEEIWDAASNGNLNMVKRAIANGIDVNMKDPKSGGTMLAAAALMGHMEIVALLLEHGADVNARSKDGGTALHAAAFLGRVETVKLLLDKGADTTLRHKMGSTAIDGAKLNWLLTKGILGTLNIEVDAAEVKAGRAEVVKLISRHK